MDIPIPEFSREQIPRFPHEKEIRSIDPVMYKPIAPVLQPIMPLLKAIYRQSTSWNYFPKDPR
jgi:hypothetical protein